MNKVHQGGSFDINRGIASTNHGGLQLSWYQKATMVLLVNLLELQALEIMITSVKMWRDKMYT